MWYSALLLLLFVSWSAPLPQGAPSKVCESMLPNHGGGIQPQAGGAPYGVFPRRNANGVMVTLTSTLGLQFGGFMLQGRTPSGEVLGVFEAPSDSSHTIDCGDNSANTLTHNSPDSKSAVETQWLPPGGYEGPVIFNATIAQDYSTFWVGVQSPPVEISKRSINDPVTQNFPTSRKPQTTTPPYFTPQEARESSTEFDPFYEGCSSRKLCFGSPMSCINSKNCKAAVAVTVSGDKYDFELKAVGAAWVGVGLSDDEKMGDDSVIECAKRGNSIRAYMSWTSGPPNYGAARLSNPQLGIQLINGSSVDDVLYCKVRRDAVTNVNGRIFDLVKDSYNILVAAGTSFKGSGVGFHDVAFLASGTKQSLSDVSALKAASKLLVRLHGSFMLAAWIGTASVGILLARYYKQTWVGGSLCGKDLWFAWHRMFMVLTWALTMTGFVLIFVELRAWSGENNPHAILGTITTVLCFVQPIGAYFRPHPGTSRRPLFNWMHWLIGNVAHIIAIVTIFFAVKLTKAELPEFVDWILVAYVAFHAIMHLVLSIMGCLSEKASERRVNSFPMKDMSPGRSPAYSNIRNDDSAYSAFRKLLLAVYIVGVLALVVALIVITALAPIEETWRSLKSSMATA